MRRGTTPTYQRTYPEDLTGGTVNFCFFQDEKELICPAEITATDYGCLVSVTLNQEQTLYFDLGNLYWQIRGVKDGKAIASDVYGEVVTDIHPNGVIEQPVTLGFYVPNETPEEPAEEEPTEETEEPETEEPIEEEPEEGEDE